jgi:hypothetical protein
LLAPCGATAKHGNYYSGKFTFFKLEKKYLLAGVITENLHPKMAVFPFSGRIHILCPILCRFRPLFCMIARHSDKNKKAA